MLKTSQVISRKMPDLKYLSVYKHFMAYKLLYDLLLKQQKVFFKMVAYAF